MKYLLDILLWSTGLIFWGIILISILKGWITKSKNIQNTYIHCDECGNELVSSGSFISDTYDKNGDNHVRYKCTDCKKISDYNFDIAPVPVNWKDLKAEE